MKNLLEIHIAVMLFGLAGLFGKLVSLPPGMIVLGRVVFAAAFILSARGLTKKALRVPGRNACFFAGVSLVIPGFDMGNATTEGALWGMLSGFTFALLSVLNRRSVQTCEPSLVALYQYSFCNL